MLKERTMANTAAALHILVDTEQQATDLLAQLEKGADFQQLAKKYSTCPSKRNGGDLGEFRKGDMVPDFDKAVFSCELLKPFGPVKTQFGYHIIKVLYRN
ncbi:peptidylprolyl isomerase PpiC [Dickeya fangzhongdai]|uniref:peptidylprolyl isomerase PpiC n=1 Tax=Dickeya fangzhongdai TaxID=1778540 RepID=UPI003F5D466E